MKEQENLNEEDSVMCDIIHDKISIYKNWRLIYGQFY